MRLAKMLAPVIAMLAGGAAQAESGTTAAGCDRACLRAAADGLVRSIVAHDPGTVPLAQSYAATENGVPAALPMMDIWHTATGASNNFYVIDPGSSQVFLLVTLAEGSHDALLFGRLKVVGGRLGEVELYVDRARGDAGFQFDAAALAHLPAAWTQAVPRDRLPTRAALLQAGRAIFDAAVQSPPPAAGCVLMENGKPVAEDLAVLKSVSPPGAPPPSEAMRNADGTYSIPCGIPPGRPTDPTARTDIVDEEQGIVVSIASISGMVEPYVITTPTESAFVPDAMLKPYVDMLGRQQGTGKYTLPGLKPMPASILVAQMHRIYDGKLQAMQMLQRLGPVGGRSPWTSR